MRKGYIAPKLIPSTSFFTNLRSMLPASEWDRLRRDCYQKAGHVCEVCGGRGPKHPVECHEIWKYNTKKGVQRLDGLIALCPACHEVVHFGLAQVRGRGKIALKHMMKVNSMPEQQCLEIVEDAFRVWERRNQTKWKLDISKVRELE